MSINSLNSPTFWKLMVTCSRVTDSWIQGHLNCNSQPKKLCWVTSPAETANGDWRRPGSRFGNSLQTSPSEDDESSLSSSKRDSFTSRASNDTNWRNSKTSEDQPLRKIRKNRPSAYSLLNRPHFFRILLGKSWQYSCSQLAVVWSLSVATTVLVCAELNLQKSTEKGMINNSLDTFLVETWSMFCERIRHYLCETKRCS